MDALRTDLDSIRRESLSRASRGWFFPRTPLMHILTRPRVLEAISSSSRVRIDERNLIVSLIVEKLPIIFSILLYDKHEENFLDFLYRQEYDSRLPLTEDDLDFLGPFVAKRFYERQWEFISPFLIKHRLHWKLRDRDILPFLHDEYIDEGCFGQVFKVTLCPGHQSLLDDVEGQNLVIARKELKSESNLVREKSMLELLRTLKHPNIMELLGSYTYKETHNLLFPIADMNLHEYFQTNINFSPEELYAGMFGLAEALSSIHKFTFNDGHDSFSCIGYHHDLKPANILIRERNFMISDFGLSKLKPNDQTSRTRLKGGSEDYLSPEAFKEFNLSNGRVGRAHDIWAFGCILAEFTTFIEMGHGSVKAFREFRKATRTAKWGTITDSAFHLDESLRPTVNQWLGNLSMQKKARQTSQLVALVREMLNPSWQTRMTASNVAQKLFRILIDSRINHIQSLLLHNSYDGDTHKADIHVLILLEKMRFKIWSDIYILLLDKLKLSDKNHTLSILNDLQHVLENIDDDGDSSRQSSLHGSMCQANDSLYEILPSYLKNQMNTQWLQAVTELSDMEQLAHIQTAARPQRYRLVGIKAAMRHICLAITHSRRVGGKSMLIEKGLINLKFDSRSGGNSAQSVIDEEPRSVKSGGRVAGIYDSESGQVPVVIEWKYYDRRWTKKQGDEMLRRVEALAKFLNSQETPRSGILKEKLLECLGYFHDEESWKFGFVYKYPPPSPHCSIQSLQYYSLNDFIRSTDYNDPSSYMMPHPPLGDIFKLVQDLVNTIAALHEVGWLQKNISSHNIIIFSSSKDRLHESLTTSVLAGWDESRPEDSSITFGPNEESVHYQHPRYRLRKTGFKRTYDYFSLGILLLEIGLWVTIVVLWQTHPECQHDAEAFREKLLVSYVPQIGERMGVLYRDAVSFCLDADNQIQYGEEGSSEHRRATQDAFQEHVVDKLARCCA